ncbi:MAG: hypothetical protein UHU19_00010 [Lachnospiraceae bacterium]|nr:hypothetical protein [Lachnospiraceae bacterium]
MSKQIDEEFVECIAKSVQDREFIYYIYSMLKEEEHKRKMIHF